MPIFIILETLFYIFILKRIFLFYNLNKKNYKEEMIPYFGGTAIFFSINTAFFFLYFLEKVSYMKCIFFLISSTPIYIVGVIDDCLGNTQVKGIKRNIHSLLNKRFTTGILKAFLILLVSCSIFYIFNEEFWLLKGIITALFANLFNLMDLRPARVLKLYYMLIIFIPFRNLQWSKELYLILILVIAVYYYFDAYGYSMLGDGGSNLIGFYTGYMITEIIGTRINLLMLLMVLLISIQIILDRYSFTKFIKERPLIDYIDRLLTERQEELNAKH